MQTTPVCGPSQPDAAEDDDDIGLLLDLFSYDVETGEAAKTTRRPLPLVKPRYRDECADVPRPCPFVSCRYNLYLDVREDGSLKINFPDREPWEMTASCALDLASDGPRTLDIIGGLMGVSKERARQLERTGTNKLRARVRKSDVFD